MSSFGFQSLGDLFGQSPTAGRYSRSRDAPPTFDSETYTRPPDTQPLFASNPTPPGLSPTSSTEPHVSSSTSFRPMEVSDTAQEDLKGDTDANALPNIIHESTIPPPHKRPWLQQNVTQNRPKTKFRSLSLKQGKPNPFLQHAASRNRQLSRPERGLKPNTSFAGNTNDTSNAQEVSSTSNRDENIEADRPKSNGNPDLNAPTKAPVSSAGTLTHVTSSGEARMVNVGEKPATHRVAIAFGYVRFSNPKPLQLIYDNNNKKGDVLGVSRIAGIMAAKRTSDLIPLCHPLALTKVEVDIKLEMPLVKSSLWSANNYGLVAITAQVECVGPTGVEMEALTAVTAAALTVIDMCKAVDRTLLIGDTRVVYKAGGRSGTFVNELWHPWGGKAWLEERGLPKPNFQASKGI